MRGADSSEVDRRIRDAYEGGETYTVGTICKDLDAPSAGYTDELLRDRIRLVRKYAVPGRLVDLCCATGEVLFSLADVSGDRVGLDFSRPFIVKATADARIAAQGGMSRPPSPRSGACCARAAAP